MIAAVQAQQHFPLSSVTQLSVHIENFGHKRKQHGKYEKRTFNTLMELFCERTFIEYPTLYISVNTDDDAMREYLLRRKS